MLVAFNWKMNPASLAEAHAIADVVKKASVKAKGVESVIIPPAVFLPTLASTHRAQGIHFGVQNIHTEQGGAFTGDISAIQAKDAGASYALVGHAERRKVGETNDDVHKKVLAAIASGLAPIICIGESARDHSGEYLEFIKSQLSVALADVSKSHMKKVVIAYEPVWAIGATEPMKPEHMHEMTIFIRKILWEKYEKAGRAVPILYGGAILNAEHAVEMAKESEVDGFLLGRLSIDSEKLPTIFESLSDL